MNDKPKSRKQRRVEHRLGRAKFRRDHAIIIVKANEEPFKGSRGKRRADMIERAERCEIQRTKIQRKQETRARLKKMKPKDRAAAREAGQRQFGERAKPWHRLGITPAEYEARGKAEPVWAQTALDGLSPLTA